MPTELVGIQRRAIRALPLGAKHLVDAARELRDVQALRARRAEDLDSV